MRAETIHAIVEHGLLSFTMEGERVAVTQCSVSALSPHELQRCLRTLSPRDLEYARSLYDLASSVSYYVAKIARKGRALDAIEQFSTSIMTASTSAVDVHAMLGIEERRRTLESELAWACERHECGESLLRSLLLAVLLNDSHGMVLTASWTLHFETMLETAKTFVSRQRHVQSLED